MAFRIGKRAIGPGEPCFITYEAGPTHDGVDSAIHLVRLAAEAGADAVKFQIFDPDRLVADKKAAFSYEVLVDRATGATQTMTEPLYDILKRRSMSRDEWRLVKAAADEAGVAFFSTVGFEDDIEFLVELGCDSIKIASADVNYHPLIRLAAQTGLVIQLDTGNATIGEIEAAVDVCRAIGNERIVIHQCPSGYPARLQSINLRIITTLHQLFGYPVAYSDHTPGWVMDVAAVALGANMVEKTITIDRTTPSVEHIFSLEPHEMREFITTIREVEVAMGIPRRLMSDEERQKRLLGRRSAFVKTAINAGTPLSDEVIEYRRPGYGIPPTEDDRLKEMRAARDIPANTRLDWSDLRAT